MSPAARAAAATHERAALRAWIRLLRVHKTLLAEVRDEMQGDVTLPRFDLLSNLDREDGQTLAALSRHMLVTAGNLTGLVDRAERDGLVERRADAHDRRATHVHLTKRGRKLFDDASRRHADRIGTRLAALEPADLETLSRLFDQIIGTGAKRKASPP
jgi:DNA-binding MarR family transcriptional regulator